MKFTKMHGAGNDFIIVNNMNGEIPADEYSALAAKYCARRTSIGADGFMVVVPSEKADFGMLFFNADGSMGEMCGNGARCIARYGHDFGLAGDTQYIEATSGIVVGERITATEYRIRLNDPSIADIHRSVEIDGTVYDCGYIELGNPGLPHGILVLPDWDKIPENELRELGRKLRYAKEFPKGANFSFVDLKDNGTVKAVTFERGVEDFTLACGTGCGSITTVLTLRGLSSGKDVKIAMPGGILTVSVDNTNGTVSSIYLTGPTCIVCTGETVE